MADARLSTAAKALIGVGALVGLMLAVHFAASRRDGRGTPPPGANPSTAVSATLAPSLSVAITVGVEGNDRPTIVGTTNLPDATELTVRLSRDDRSYTSEDEKVVIARGQFRAGPFSRRGAPLDPGVYAIEVSSPFAARQPAAVRAVIGHDGERLQGPLVRDAGLGGRIIAYRTTVEVRVATPVAHAVETAADTTPQVHEGRIQTCKDRCDWTKLFAARNNEPFSWDTCNQQCLAEERQQTEQDQ